MPGVTSASLCERVDEIVDLSQTKVLVAAYFDPLNGFAGATFDQLEPNPSRSFNTSDLLSVNLLDEKVGPQAIRALLAGHANSPLGAVEDSVDLWQSTPEIRQSMNTLRAVLLELDGVGPTTAAKLCARKRPRLMPIYDSVVERVLRLNRGPWWDALAESLMDADRRDRIRALDPELVAYHPSLLRLLDVAVWMVGSNARSARNARELAGLPPDPKW